MAAAFFWITTGIFSSSSIIAEWVRGDHGTPASLIPLVLVPLCIMFLLRWCHRLVLPSGVWAWLFTVVGPVCTVGYFLTGFWLLATCGWLITVLMIFGHARTERTSLESAGWFRRIGSVLGGSLYSTIPLVLLLAPVPKIYWDYAQGNAEFLSRELASFVLDLSSINHQFSVEQLILVDHDLSLELLTGIFGLAVYVFLALFIQALRDRPFFLIPFYVACGWIASIISSALVVLLQVLIDTVDMPIAPTTGYWVAQFVALTLSVFFLLSADRFVLVTFFPTRIDQYEKRNNPLLAIWNSLWLSTDLNTKSQVDG